MKLNQGITNLNWLLSSTIGTYIQPQIEGEGLWFLSDWNWAILATFQVVYFTSFIIPQSNVFTILHCAISLEMPFGAYVSIWVLSIASLHAFFSLRWQERNWSVGASSESKVSVGTPLRPSFSMNQSKKIICLWSWTSFLCVISIISPRISTMTYSIYFNRARISNSSSSLPILTLSRSIIGATRGRGASVYPGSLSKMRHSEWFSLRLATRELSLENNINATPIDLNINFLERFIIFYSLLCHMILCTNWDTSCACKGFAP